MDTPHIRMTTADYLAMPDDSKRYELHDGVLIEMPSASPTHMWIVMTIIRVLSAYVYERSLGFVASDSLDYYLADGIVLQPDVSFVANLFPPLPKRLEMSPDLAIEVLSPSNSASEMSYKSRMYLQYGSRLVWLVDPEKRLVTAHHKDAAGVITTTYLTDADTLTGADVLPDFRLPVRDLFWPPAPPSPAL
jgi:Uma2 family endonuclease